MNAFKHGRIRQLFALAFVLLLSKPLSVFAQRSATANSTATIIQGITITKNTNLRFGALIPGAAGGTVTISAAGVRSSTGTITLISSGTFPATAATFSLLGAPNLTYTITLPTTTTLTRQGGSDTILVSTFTSSPTVTGSLTASGTGSLSVGGTISIAGGQAAGVYSGSFTVTLTYQ